MDQKAMSEPREGQSVKSLEQFCQVEPESRLWQGEPWIERHTLKFSLERFSALPACLVLFSNLKVYFKNKAFFSQWISDVSHVCEKKNDLGFRNLLWKLKAVNQFISYTKSPRDSQRQSPIKTLPMIS